MADDQEHQKHPIEMIAETCGGTIKEVVLLPDGRSGFATMSIPLRSDHWVYNQGGSANSGPPPIPFRMGVGDQASLLIQRKASDRPFGIDPPIRMTREDFAQKVREAAMYAVRSSTMCGTDWDFDPDAMLQNMVVGMLGYWTDTGLSSDEWANPQQEPRQPDPSSPNTPGQSGI